MHIKFVENHFWVLGQNDKMIKVLHGGSLWAPKSCYLTYVRPLIRQIQACYDVGNSGADSEETVKMPSCEHHVADHQRGQPSKAFHVNLNEFYENVILTSM